MALYSRIDQCIIMANKDAMTNCRHVHNLYDKQVVREIISLVDLKKDEIMSLRNEFGIDNVLTMGCNPMTLLSSDRLVNIVVNLLHKVYKCTVNGGSVCIHDSQGKHRSAAVAMCFLMLMNSWSWDHALVQLKAMHQIANPSMYEGTVMRALGKMSLNTEVLSLVHAIRRFR